MHILKHILLTTATLFLGGCYFIPEYRTDTKVPSLHGQILDARTNAPVYDAKISLIYDDYSNGDHRAGELSSQNTDAKGIFNFKQTFNHYYIGVLGPCGDDLPHGKHCDRIKISKDGYEELDVGFNVYWSEYHQDDRYISPDPKTGLLLFYIKPTTPTDAPRKE